MEGADDPKSRFSSRVADYVRYRPTYPPGVLDVLRAHGGMRPGWAVADVGSGTGISCELFLRAGHAVFAVEPNAGMRAAAEAAHGGNALFHSVAASAERTTLPDAAVDLVHCAQAFHWTDRPRAAAEFRRVVRPGGAVAVVWNERLTTGTRFLVEYEALLHRCGTDYAAVARQTTSAKDLDALLGLPVRRHTLPNRQAFDLDGLLGRAMSSSYVPRPGSPTHAALVDGLRDLFGRHAAGGRVEFLYTTEIFLARVPPAG